MHHFKELISKLSPFASKGRLRKEQNYLKNGSAVLEEFLTLCDGKCRIPLRYFSAIEIERATKDAENSVIFIKGTYMVKGLLDKRSILVNFTYCNFDRKFSDVCRDIAITSQMSHLKNVLKIIGCCLEYGEPVMVYEYVEDAITLDDLLSNNGYARNSSIPWESRLRIANEIASVIVFLHSEFTTPIIFRDLHSQKVLIDQSSGVSKLYDFSFSVPLPPGELEVEAQDGVRGTCGHPDPEYCCSGIVTQKTDVYSFGNVLLQLLTGKKEYVRNGAIIKFGETYLESNMEECNVMDIADPDILAGERGIHDIRQQLEDYFDLVKRCTVTKGDDRPYMIYVARELRRMEKCFHALSTPVLN
ncbi:putative trehalose-phosphate phosphatase F-like [Capsicum annuum]|nr:putative trehalose-phosphate phosphatase F-like [Capsicum annuum]